VSNTVFRYLRWLVIIPLGNGIYYAFFPWLPRALKHQTSKVDLGTLLDAGFCLIVFGIFELVAFLQKNRGQTSHQ